MAEIFGAVASGAGLMSLSLQLLESSQKLKSLYNASKDAPQTVADLSFELETMSLSLRQLVIHNQADITSDTLLGRCMMTCTLMTAKIEAAVDKMEYVLRKSRGVGRMYAAFKEPEISKLLEGLEHAKSSMLFAYMSYCQSWNLREASLRASEAQAQNAVLSSHETELRNLGLVVQSGHATILERIETTRLSGSWSPSHSAPIAYHARQGLVPQDRTRRPSARTFRFALPRWLSTYVWEFATHELDGAWNFHVRPVNVRAPGTFVFDVVRSGNVEAVRKHLASGELSASDCESDSYEPWNKSLLYVAAQHSRLELCEFLLREFPTYYTDDDLHRVLKVFIQVQLETYIGPREKERFPKLIKAFYTLFLRKHGISVDLQQLIDQPTVKHDRDQWLDDLEDIGSNPLLTDEALHEVIMSQTIPFNKWHPVDRFCAAVNAKGWPAGAFVKLIGIESDVQLARLADHRGKTALHWAAEHFGCWMSRSVVFPIYKHYEALHREYGELCKMVINKSADLHALDSENRTPFTFLLRALHTGHECWFDYDLCDAVEQWGQYVQDAGVSLYAYAAAENCLLSRFDSVASNLRIHAKGHPWTCRLVITETLTLAIEVGYSVSRPLWQYNPPPGSWRREGYQIEKIGWEPVPYFEGDEFRFWQQAENSGILLPPELIRPYEPSLFREWAASAWRNWFTGVQDDHGFVCMTMQRSSSMSRGRGRVRRAASLPPPNTILEDRYGRPDGQCYVNQATAESWTSNPHKCPLDLTWKSTYCAKNEYYDSRRRCMLGRCDDDKPELLRSRHWEVKLLDDEKNIEVARRFTDRFRPEWRHILEDNHRRAQRRAELGISATGTHYNRGHYRS